MAFLENPIYVLSMLALMVMLAVYVERTSFGRPLGAALLAIVFTAIIANMGLIPSASNTIFLYEGIFTYVAPLSIFYLMLGVNLKAIKKAGLPMIGLFVLGSLATVVGILVAWHLISPEGVLGENGPIIAGMLTGTYTGGSVNFNAIALEYDFQKQGALYAGTIAVDNVVTTVWIVVTLAMPRILKKFWKDKKGTAPKNTEEHGQKDNGMDLNSLMWLLFLGLAAFFISEALSKILPELPSILTLTTLGVILAQTPFVSKLNGAHTLGLYSVYLFLAVIGAYCEINAVLELKTLGLTLFLFTATVVLIHGITTILLGGLLYRDWSMIAIASQANIGGGPTALALAETFGRKELMLPAILVGTLGNALGTYFGFLVIQFL
ncbi:DUF819 family protein [Muricauda sp. SCSIO 64092]|uniref:DUF819 family protein n=1 Tax=Allomuricauda sp. SCSIO 64092 TaxID=2908842 RepID=UPI001FF2B3DA|nr:DUF819 family protein [Muricauda sp. SCSIO 64092]UOY08684.1 DUF819 family protein [Muricauda sp. SCSIO 64092]